MKKGGKREGAGRPPGSMSRKPVRVFVKQVRWTPDEWAEVKRISADAGMTPSEYIRQATLTERL